MRIICTKYYVHARTDQPTTTSAVFRRRCLLVYCFIAVRASPVAQPAIWDTFTAMPSPQRPRALFLFSILFHNMTTATTVVMMMMMMIVQIIIVSIVLIIIVVCSNVFVLVAAAAPGQCRISVRFPDRRRTVIIRLPPFTLCNHNIIHFIFFPFFFIIFLPFRWGPKRVSIDPAPQLLPRSPKRKHFCVQKTTVSHTAGALLAVDKISLSRRCHVSITSHNIIIDDDQSSAGLVLDGFRTETVAIPPIPALVVVICAREFRLTRVNKSPKNAE